MTISWAPDLPKVDGIYWKRFKGNVAIILVNVRPYCEFRYFGDETYYEPKTGTEWLGPIKEPS
jgi:hypothetical protein